VPEGEPCPYCAHLAPSPEELPQPLLHLHPEVEPEPDWWDRDAATPPVLWYHRLTIEYTALGVVDLLPPRFRSSMPAPTSGTFVEAITC
jgi:hypothetical protein